MHGAIYATTALRVPPHKMIRQLIAFLLLAGPTVVNALCDPVRDVARAAGTNGFNPAGLSGNCGTTGNPASKDDQCDFVVTGTDSYCFKGFKRTIDVTSIICEEENGTPYWHYAGHPIKTGTAGQHESLAAFSNALCETPTPSSQSTCEGSPDYGYFVSGEAQNADDACECQPNQKQKDWHFATAEWVSGTEDCDKTVAPMQDCPLPAGTSWFFGRSTTGTAPNQEYEGGLKLKGPCYDNNNVGTCQVECFDGLVGAYFQDAVCATVNGVSGYYLYGRPVSGTNKLTVTTWTVDHCKYLNDVLGASETSCAALTGTNSNNYASSTQYDDTCTCDYGDHNPDHDHPDPVWDHAVDTGGWKGQCAEWTTTTTSTTIPSCNTLTQRGPGHATCRSEQESSDGAAAVSGAVVGTLAAAAATAAVLP